MLRVNQLIGFGARRADGVAASPFYVNTYDDTSNVTGGSPYTFGPVSSAAGAYRRVYVAYSAASASSIAAPSATIGGVAATVLVHEGTTIATGIMFADVPTGTSLSIDITFAVNCTSCRASVFVTYDQYPTLLDYGSNSNGAGNTTVANIRIKNGGFLLATSAQSSATSGMSHTWTGADAVVEDNESVVESTTRTETAHILTTEAADTFDLTGVRSGGAIVSVAASFEIASGTPPVAEYLNTFASTGSATTYNYLSVPIGKEDADRIVIVPMYWNTSGTTITISSATIGGVSASIACQNGGTGGGTGIIYAAVPSGDVADVSITFSAGALGSAIAAYRGTPATATPLDAVTSGYASSTTRTASDVEISNGGFMIAVGHVRTANNMTGTWTGTDTLVEDTEYTTDGMQFWVGSVLATETDATRDLTVSSSGTAGRSLAAASWL